MLSLRYVKDQSTADDVLQESFMIIFNKIETVRSNASFEGWIKTITINCALNWLRKNQLVKRTNHSASVPLTISPKVYQDISKEEILKVVHSLPEMNRLVFTLNIIDGYSHKEIAELLKINETTSRSYLLRARKILQKKMIFKDYKKERTA